jgi:glucose 1-dehydrogenase
VLVNNAAMMTFEKVVDLTTDERDMGMKVNLPSGFLFCKYRIRTWLKVQLEI